ncbi:hypothetical protein NWF24_20120 [Variovorax paradoxus]|uniref:hypothetical protein n=1 Tax=Variovorax paradoxus TaxID=34073 RepID=UPI0021ABA83D|nr:hypothetical protein [Variovorax paradoxus]UVH55138.1 hypothetical protein NWF24_20120 [Variovorax paradoxus]
MDYQHLALAMRINGARVITDKNLPGQRVILRGSNAFRKNLPREAVYKTATFLVNHHWGNAREMADGMGVLLLTWNQAFYRYGQFDFLKLERCIEKNMSSLESIRMRNILEFGKVDEPLVRRLFEGFSAALAIRRGSKEGMQSPVATAKALHLLAPSFLALWDHKIARGYGCYYANDPVGKYLDFLWMTKAIAIGLPKSLQDGADGYSAIKVIDEYNFARFTRGWVNT